MKLVAFYLPQFHPTPDNDRFWGRGFTEWTNVAAARPLFRGHAQPRVPGDLGFYDLRLPETRAAQAELARAHGIDAFCYYHYWFEGRRLLARPFDEVLASGEPDLPVCLCWANESWSRRWLGEERDLLVPQTYSRADDERHARWLARAFADPRYLRHDGRPLFLVYRPHDLPRPAATFDLVRAASEREVGQPAFVVGVDAHRPGADMRALGCDDTLAFRPQLGCLPGAFDDRPSLARLRRNWRLGRPSASLKLYDERWARRAMAALPRAAGAPDPIPCAFVGWDNSPRRGAKGIVLVDGSAAAYEEDLVRAIEGARASRGDDALVFVNAWNEWAEGNCLEPDRERGHAYLEATARARARAEASLARATRAAAPVDAVS